MNVGEEAAALNTLAALPSLTCVFALDLNSKTILNIRLKGASAYTASSLQGNPFFLGIEQM